MNRILRKFVFPALRCLAVCVMLASFGLTTLASAMGFEQVPNLKKPVIEPPSSPLDQIGAAASTGDAGKMSPKQKQTNGWEISVIASGTSRADNDSGRYNKSHVWDVASFEVSSPRSSFTPVVSTVALSSPKLAHTCTLVGARPSGTM